MDVLPCFNRSFSVAPGSPIYRRLKQLGLDNFNMTAATITSKKAVEATLVSL